MRTSTIFTLAMLLSACSGKDDNPFGSGGSGDRPDTSDGGSSSGDGGGADDTGSTSDGGTADGGSGDGGGEDTGFVIVGTGYDSGDTAYDLAGTSQAGAFSLHALYGTPVLLIVGHLDEAGMQDMVSWMGRIDGVISVAVIGKDESGATADAADASTLAATHSIDHVLTDPTGELLTTWAERNPPKTYLIDGEMVIYWTAFGTVGQAQVEDKIDQMEG